MRNKQFNAWSYSRLRDYCECPFKAKLKYLDKISEPPNPAMQRGLDIHKLAEDYIKGSIARLPKELKNFEALFKQLKAQFKKKVHGMTIEETWAFTKDWGLTVWNDWAGCALRIKVDAAYYQDDGVFIVTDWKTGKNDIRFKETYEEQIELFALGALLVRDVKIVRPQLAYLDTGEIFSEVEFTPKDVPALKKKWEKKSKPMLNDVRFAPRANDRCCWCFYRKNNKAAGGGQCKF